MQFADDYSRVFSDKQKILVVTAHPDDAEIMCGGLISRLTKDGKEVRLIVMTNGGKGFQGREDTSETTFGALRIAEQHAGANILGVKAAESFNLELPDGEIDNSLITIERIVFHIRQFKPEIVITHNVDDVVIKFSEDTNWVNHRDHRHTAQVVVDAVYPYSRDRGFFPEHFTESGLSQHTVQELLFVDIYQGEDLVRFDITDFVEQKTKALQEHKNAIDPEHAPDYIQDFLNEDGRYREVMKWVKVY